MATFSDPTSVPPGWRWDDGTWARDDGETGLRIVVLEPGGPVGDYTWQAVDRETDRVVAAGRAGSRAEAFHAAWPGG